MRPGALLCASLAGTIACTARSFPPELQEVEQQPDAGNPGPPPPPVGPIVLDAWSEPLPGVAVVIGGQVLRTDASGRFVMPAVPSPYDVVLVESEPQFTTTYEFDGMTSTKPVFVMFAGGTSPHHEAWLGVQAPAGSTSKTMWTAHVDGPGVTHVSQGTGSDSDLRVHWDGPPVAPAHVTELAYDADGNGTPTQYTGAAEFDAYLVDGKRLHVTPTLGPVPWPTVVVHATSTPAPTGEWASFSVSWSMGVDDVPLQATQWGALPSAALPVLQMTGFAYQAAVSTGATGTGDYAYSAPTASAAQLDGVGVALIDPPHIVSPIPGASGVTPATPLVVDPGPQGLLVRQVGGENFFYLIASPRTDVRIPDVPEAGAPFPRGAAVQWGAFMTTFASSVDDLAANGAFGGYRAGSTAWDESGYFTTAP